MRRTIELAELANNPDALLEKGFSRSDESSTDLVRWVRYSKSVQSGECQLRLSLNIEYELGISDDPYVAHLQHSYSFNGVSLEIYDRQMEEQDSRYYDEETERPRLIGSARLSLKRLDEVEHLLELLVLRTSGLLL